MICPKCSAEIDNRFKTCPECGAAFELPPGTVFGDIRIRRKKKAKEKTPEELKRTKRRILIGFGIFFALLILCDILVRTGLWEEIFWYFYRLRFPMHYTPKT